MNRLRYTQKFLLLGVAMAVVMVVLLTTVYSNLSRDIETARHEIAGLQMLKPMNRMVQFMQQHRGLSSGVLNGNEAMKDKRIAKEKEVAEMVLATDAALSSFLRETARWKAIRQDWADIAAQGMSWAPPENIKRHSVMIDKVLIFMGDVADAAQLTLDPAMDTYYFMDTVVMKMPAMLEPMGITRARGTGILAKKELTLQERLDISVLIAQMSGTLRAQTMNLEKVTRFAPELQASLSGPTKEFSDGAEKVFALVREDILGEKFTMAPNDYFALTSQLIDIGYKMMFETLIPQFEKQLQSRMAGAERLLMLDTAFALTILLLIGYLALGTYYSVIGSVEVFSRGARELASGNLTAEFV
ncbi:MAG: nitrate- and nitrite sensing domain-containing protein, partial [Azonexus sp.]|nr:nitrate- and nitrite sensing domain-containing protein [Azonexus sp.]